MIIIPTLNSARDSSPAGFPEETIDDAIELDLEYICPMNCEQGKTYSKKGFCNVCKIPLIILQTKDVFDGQNFEDNIESNRKENLNGTDTK
ncbi:heavy metal-binding domain-containing protein [Seonamhaeicola maritimus]|uniref:heavy metal-binding domain-containing protein n=1 Tax=Seonamhaeicola maritimus TaxID=2591822 RepID=UPI0024957565|nr:heavy metal-binding domain-containing protein [Seonamhaeicola maritimus]